MYAHIAASYDELHAAEQQRKFLRLVSRVTLQAYSSVLDIGCATAHLSSYFSEQDYLGVDPCKELLEQAPKHVRTLCAAGEDLPLPDNHSQLVLSLTALHNYEDPIKGVKEIARVSSHAALIGVLRKSSRHDEIVNAVKEHFFVRFLFVDQHDTLLVCVTRNT